MEIQLVLSHIKHTACYVGAVIRCPFEVCKKVGPDKTGIYGAFALLQPENMSRSHLLFKAVYHLFQRFNL